MTRLEPCIHLRQDLSPAYLRMTLNESCYEQQLSAWPLAQGRVHEPCAAAGIALQTDCGTPAWPPGGRPDW